MPTREKGQRWFNWNRLNDPAYVDKWIKKQLALGPLEGQRNSNSEERMRPRSKYRAQKTEYNGQTYDSKAEAARAEKLDGMLLTGTIAGYARQVQFRVGLADIKYRPDFLVHSADGSVWAEDVKGMETPRFKMTRKLWAKYGPIGWPDLELHILKGKNVDVVRPGKSEAIADEEDVVENSKLGTEADTRKERTAGRGGRSRGNRKSKKR